MMLHILWINSYLNFLNIYDLFVSKCRSVEAIIVLPYEYLNILRPSKTGSIFMSGRGWGVIGADILAAL